MNVKKIFGAAALFYGALTGVVAVNSFSDAKNNDHDALKMVEKVCTGQVENISPVSRGVLCAGGLPGAALGVGMAIGTGNHNVGLKP